MVGHTGDCRIVLSEKGGIARDLTIDHKPINASEKEVWSCTYFYELYYCSLLIDILDITHCNGCITYKFMF
jgi:hypothetical protein